MSAITDFYLIIFAVLFLYFFIRWLCYFYAISAACCWVHSPVARHHIFTFVPYILFYNVLFTKFIIVLLLFFAASSARCLAAAAASDASHITQPFYWVLYIDVDCNVVLFYF